MPIKILKKTENPMADERFYQQRREALIDSGIPANMIDKFNATPNKLDASRILKKRKEKFKKAENPMADERFNAAFRSRMKKAGLKDSEIGDTRLKAGGLSGGQAKLAAKAPPPNKIDAKDFAVLKAEKAKGRGMGLQDESIKPGKVMKAKTGKQIVKEFSASLKGIDESFKSKVHPMKKQRLLDRSTVMTKAKYGKIMKAKRGKFLGSDPTKPISSVQPSTTLPKDFLGKRKALGGVRASLGMLKGPAKAGAILGAALTVPVGKMLKKIQDKRKAKNRDEAKVKKMVGGMAKKYSNGMMNKPMGYSSGSKLMDFIKSGSYTDKYGTKTNVDKAIKKINLSPKDKDLATMKPASDKKMMGGGMMQRPMGGPMGGMMQRPMGYKKGTMVKARGCKLGRTRPTKMY
jgi:hypothetical protein